MRISFDIDVALIKVWEEKRDRRREEVEKFFDIISKKKEILSIIITPQIFRRIKTWKNKKIVKRLEDLFKGYQIENPEKVILQFSSKFKKGFEEIVRDFAKKAEIKEEDAANLIAYSLLGIEYFVTLNKKHLRNKYAKLKTVGWKFGLKIPEIMLPAEFSLFLERYTSDQISSSSPSKSSSDFNKIFSSLSHTIKINFDVFKSFLLLLVVIDLSLPSVLAQVQSHPLPEINANLNISSITILFIILISYILLRFSKSFHRTETLDSNLPISNKTPATIKVLSNVSSGELITPVAIRSKKIKPISKSDQAIILKIKSDVLSICHHFCNLFTANPAITPKLKLRSRLFKALFLPILLSFLFIPTAFAQIQSHPLSQIFPVEANLNMSNNSAGIAYNITGVGYLGIGTTGLPAYRLDVAGSGWIRPSLFIGGNKIEILDAGNNMLGVIGGLNLTGDLQVGGNDLIDSNGVTRLSLGNPVIIASGTDLHLLSGNLLIGSMTVIDSSRNIINVGWVNATNVNVLNQLCLGGECKSSWPSLASAGGWTDEGFYVRLTSSSDKVIIGADYAPQQKLDVVGNINATGTLYAADLSCSDCIALGSETTGNYIANVTAGTGISITGTPGEGWTPTIGIDTNVVPQKSQAESINGVWNFANGLKVGGGYENNALTIDQYGNILTKGNLTYSGYTYVISTLEFNGTANYPFGVNVGGTYGGTGYDGFINFNSSAGVVKGRIYTDGSNLIVDTSSYGANLLVTGDLLPSGTRNLGSSSSSWNTIYGSSYYVGTTQVIDSSRNVVNVQDVNATRFFQGSNRVIDTVSAGSGLTGGGTGPSVSLSVAFGDNFLGWKNLTAYDSSCQCGAGYAVQTINDTCTCVAITPGGAGVVGSGTVGYIPMWNGSNSLNNSVIYQSGSNVGIGTTEPIYTLDVKRDIYDYVVRIYNTRATSGENFGLYITAGSSSADKALLIRNYGGNDLFAIRGDGNVGIGTTSPTSKLNVIGTFNATSNNGVLFLDGNGNIKVGI